MLYKLPVFITHPTITGIAVNTWHIDTDSNTFPATAEVDELSSIIEEFYTAYADFAPTQTQFEFTGEVTSMGADPQTDAACTPWTVDGEQGVDSLPPANAVCVTWRTPSATRSGRGRTFLSPVAVNRVQSDGTILTTELGELRTAALFLVSSQAGSAAGRIGVWSPLTETFRSLSGATISDKFAVLRSRRD